MKSNCFCKWLREHVKSIVMIGFFIIFTIFVLIYNHTLDFARPADIEAGNVYTRARVTAVLTDTLAPDPDFPTIKIGRQDLKMVITSGDYKGREVTAKNYVERLKNAPAEVGSIMVISSYDDFITTTIVDYSRESTLYILGVIYIAVVLIFGKKKGLSSLFSLVFTLVCILFLFIPMVVRGINPILSASVVAVLSTAVTLLTLNGWSKKSLTAAVSCIVCTTLAGLIAWIAGSIAHINTINTNEAQNLLFVSQYTSLHIDHLLYAGILFASLGAIMDTTMSVTSALSEMQEIDSTLSRIQLFRSGMNIGRDMMGTMTNTLILAFTGSSINLFVLYFMYQMPYAQLINLQLLVVEIIRGLTGSITVVLSIPATAILAATVFTRKPQKTIIRKAVKK